MLESSWGRGLAATALTLYAALLAAVLFWPTSNVQSHAILAALPYLHELGIPPGMLNFQRAEVLSNVAIVMPVTFLGAIVVRRWTWQEWTAYVFIGAVFVETFQGIVLPHRQASFSDIVANTFGALLGAILVAPHRREVP